MTTPYPTRAGGGCPSDHGDRKGADTPRMSVYDGNLLFPWERNTYAHAAFDSSS